MLYKNRLEYIIEAIEQTEKKINDLNRYKEWLENEFTIEINKQIGNEKE